MQMITPTTHQAIMPVLPDDDDELPPTPEPALLEVITDEVIAIAVDREVDTTGVKMEGIVSVKVEEGTTGVNIVDTTGVNVVDNVIDATGHGINIENTSSINIVYTTSIKVADTAGVKVVDISYEINFNAL